jgi:hypothetical protein
MYASDPYFTSFTGTQCGSPPDQVKQALRISGLPSASKLILIRYAMPALRFPFSGTSKLNSLISPGSRGPFGTVAQEEITNKIATLVRIEVITLFISVSPYEISFCVNLSEFFWRCQQKFRDPKAHIIVGLRREFIGEVKV